MSQVIFCPLYFLASAAFATAGGLFRLYLALPGAGVPAAPPAAPEAFVDVALLVLPRVDPGRANYASFAGPYTVLRYALSVMMAAMHTLLIAVALR